MEKILNYEYNVSIREKITKEEYFTDYCEKLLENEKFAVLNRLLNLCFCECEDVKFKANLLTLELHSLTLPDSLFFMRHFVSPNE